MYAPETLNFGNVYHFQLNFPPTRLTPSPRPHHPLGNVFFKINGRKERDLNIHLGEGGGEKPLRVFKISFVTSLWDIN